MLRNKHLVKGKSVHTAVKKKDNYALCGDLLRIILARDGWTLRAVNTPLSFAPHAVFVAGKEERRAVFFFSDQPVRSLTAAFRRIQRQDRSEFKLLGVLITPTTEEMQRLRNIECAGKFPRAFFASLEEISEIAGGGAPSAPRRSGGVLSFKAEVLTNTPVGSPQDSLYRLAFKAPPMQEIQPIQFIMMDATPISKSGLGARSVRRGNLRGAMDLVPRPFLKRPFGICREFHPHFAPDYLKRLSLPPSLALVLHLPAADHFDLLYKVLPNGVGTPLMTKLKRGQKIEMTGPMGRPFDARRLRAEGVEEVHVIGGGVGMAPLIRLVEALRYYAFPVKAFLGIARFQSLRYRNELATTLRSRDAYVYVDDLFDVGMKAADIYVSCESEIPSRHCGIIRGIPPENLFRGLVTEQYRRFLGQARNDTAGKRSSVAVFACGPDRMMEIVGEITQKADIPLQVLLEKRMACGIGVCFSCVCNVRRANGAEDHARVCTEGLLFDAKDILWKK